MTNPTPLSPAAQAVITAILEISPAPADEIATATLRAVANQVDYYERLGWTGYGYYTEFQNQILTIAAELEAR